MWEGHKELINVPRRNEVRLDPSQDLAASRLEKIVHFRHVLAVLVQALHSTKPPSFTVFIILFSAFTLFIFVSTT